MSTNPANKSDQEIDLSMISRGIENFFQRISNGIFGAIQFVLKHIIILVVLLIVGIGLGIYLDQTRKAYDHQIIVQPNFGSTDYLYSKIDLIQSKVREGDTVFLKAIGMKDADKFTKIEIKPILDVYRFINQSEQNFELLKLMAEDSDIKKVVEEKATSKNYVYHLISFKTEKLTNREKTVEPLLNYFNNSAFFRKIQKEYVNNEKTKMQANVVTLAQIDAFLNGIANPANAKGEKLVYYNENSPLNDVLKTKDRLLTEQGNLRVDLISMDKIVKENSAVINIENMEAVNGKLKFVLPLLFILVFVAINYFIGFYQNQMARNK